MRKKHRQPCDMNQTSLQSGKKRFKTFSFSPTFYLLIPHQITLNIDEVVTENSSHGTLLSLHLNSVFFNFIIRTWDQLVLARSAGHVCEDLTSHHPLTGLWMEHWTEPFPPDGRCKASNNLEQSRWGDTISLNITDSLTMTT